MTDPSSPPLGIHERLETIISRLPRSYLPRVKAMRRKFAICGKFIVGGAPGGEPLITLSGKPRLVHRTWTCGSMFCGADAKMEGGLEVARWAPLLASRLREGHGWYAATFGLVPVVGMSLVDALLLLDHTKARFFRNPRFRELCTGGLWNVEATRESRAVSPESEERSWYVHTHMLMDLKGPEVGEELQGIWDECLLEESDGEAGLPVHSYVEPAGCLEAYVRYLHKEWSITDWDDEDLYECALTFFKTRAPVRLKGSFGRLNGRCKQGRPYRRALKEQKAKLDTIPVPNLDVPQCPDVGPMGISFQRDRSGRASLLRASGGRGLTPEEAVALESLGSALEGFFWHLRARLRDSQEVYGFFTGAVVRREEAEFGYLAQLYQRFKRLNPGLVPAGSYGVLHDMALGF